jgi:hypothetical protein
MLLSRAQSRRVGRIVLLLLISMQGAFAMNAGFMFGSATHQLNATTTEVAPSCHGKNQANPDPGRTLCRAHCLADAQNLAQAEVPSLAPCLGAAPILVLQALPAGSRTPPRSWLDASTGDPPIPIRFCSFQI